MQLINWNDYDSSVCFVSGIIWIPYTLSLFYLFREHQLRKKYPQNVIVLLMAFGSCFRCVWFFFSKADSEKIWMLVINRVAILLQFTALWILILMWYRALQITQISYTKLHNSDLSQSRMTRRSSEEVRTTNNNNNNNNNNTTNNSSLSQLPLELQKVNIQYARVTRNVLIIIFLIWVAVRHITIIIIIMYYNNMTNTNTNTDNITITGIGLISMGSSFMDLLLCEYHLIECLRHVTRSRHSHQWHLCQSRLIERTQTSDCLAFCLASSLLSSSSGQWHGTTYWCAARRCTV
jgi:hypothetical protein